MNQDQTRLGKLDQESAGEIGEDELAVSLRAYEKNPGHARFGMRIGYPAWGRIGIGGGMVKG